MGSTIGDVAAALGISKGTVSRAITGNGRISPQTRQRILDYMDKHDFHPNAIAQNLSRRNTMTLAFTIPSDRRLVQYPYYLQYLAGIISASMERDYDILAVDNTYSAVRRAVAQGKVDGVIVSRNPVEPKMLAYLSDAHFPFVVIGPTSRKDVIRIDHDHTAACKEFTTVVLARWNGKPGLIAGPKTDLISRARAKGFTAAAHSAPVAWGAIDEESVLAAFRDLTSRGADIIFCADDMICGFLEANLRSGQLGDTAATIRVASFHASPTLNALNPRIPALSFDSASLGSAACSTLLDRIAGENVASVTLGYDILLGPN